MNNQEYISEKLSKIDAECEELQHAIAHHEKKIGKLEAEKKMVLYVAPVVVPIFLWHQWWSNSIGDVGVRAIGYIIEYM